MEESLILVSGYGAPGEEDIALYRIEAAGGVRKLYGMSHGGSPSFCCKGAGGRIYAASERPDGAEITVYELQQEALQQDDALLAAQKKYQQKKAYMEEKK